MAIRNDAHLDQFHRDQQWHKPCRVATTASITISTALNAGDSLDGVTLAAGDRVLVKDQGTGSQNGIYIAGASPARAYDMEVGIQAMGAFVYVMSGTANAGKLFKCTNVTLPTIGSTSLSFTEFTAAESLAATVLNAKGDLITATAADTPAILTAGANESDLITLSSESTGLLWRKNNVTTSDPTTGDDSGDGYRIGSRWLNTSTDEEFVALDVSVGAAVWVSTTDTGGSAVDVTDGSTTVTAATEIEFDAADFSVTDQGGGSALVEFTGTVSGGGDDSIPTGGTLYDGTSTTGWTSFGSPDTFDADSTIPGALYVLKNTMGGNNLVGAYHAVGGSFPRTYTMRIRDSLQHANYHSAGIVIGEASPGKFVSWGYVYEDNFRYLQRYGWTTASSAGANTNYGGSRDIGVGISGHWFRIVVNSSTDIEFWQSMNGFIWYPYATAVNPGFTVGCFGFGMSTFAAIRHAMAVDWIHET